MKFTLGWLKDHLDTTASLNKIATTLSAIGLEVDDISDPSVLLSEFTIARVTSAKQHPNADRLRVCAVEISPGAAPVEVVCGAPNARDGLIGVFAPLGSYIPGTGLTLDKRPVRGVISNGMLLSERELELSDNHEGIIELDSSLSNSVGERFIDVMGLNDPVIEIGLTPNRPDCTGVRGIARDLAAAGLGSLNPEPEIGQVEGDFACPINIELAFEPEFSSACPVFAGRYVRGVTNGSAPHWMQQRLKAVGLRPISALVDMTNYISLDRGRPLHVYDADKLSGNIRARMATDGESFLALDGKSYTADKTMCVIADDKGVLGYGGIIGGEETGCTAETTNVLIECAYFDPVRTAETGRKNGIFSDARYRFERGVDPAFVKPGLDLATDYVIRMCGGTPSQAQIAGKAPILDRKLDFDFGSVKKLTGLAVNPDESRNILMAIGCTIDGAGRGATIGVPSWRPDILGPADLVEEVIRIVGLEKIPSTAMTRSRGVASAVLTDQQKRSRRARRVLAARGLVEVVTWSFLTHQAATHFGGGGSDLDLDNPISVELSSMRPSLLPGLLWAAQRNINRGFQDVALFELGQAYRDDTDRGQLLLAAGVRFKTAGMLGAGRHWAGAAELVGPFDVKADASAVLSALGVDISRAQISRDAPAWFHPGRSGTLRLGPHIALAHFGEVHPATLKLLEVDGPAMAFEINLSALPATKRKVRDTTPLTTNDLLPLRRDFAFVLDQAVPASDVLKAAFGADRKLIVEVNVFDVFDGKGVGEGKKSIAIEVMLQPQVKTLTDAEIESVSAKLVSAVSKSTGGEIRG